VHRLLEILIENAIDNVEAGGEGGWLRIELSSEPGGVVTRVSDSGPPVPEETLHRVFEPFFTTKPGRPGLGLSVARALVRAHEGRIWTDQHEDGRAVFAVQLPIGGGDAKARFRPVPLVLSHNQAILVVDDEEAIRLSMRRFLEKVGYDVREAWSGRSALAQITGGRPPDLVLTDLRMRDGSGFWFLEELERDFPDLLRKTVILTGDPDHAEVKRLVARTGCPVVGKPVELPDLLELLDEVTRRD
jgi:CheY-like chemotaxis protein